MNEYILLERTVKMPKSVDYTTGAVSICFSNARLEKSVAIESRTGEKLTLSPMKFSCDFSVKTAFDPEINVDTGGRLTVLDSKTPATDDGEKAAWLDNAREQRTRLAQTQQGRTMLMAYGTYNEQYNDAFGVRVFLQKWDDSQGVTKAMCADTHSSVKKPDDPINGKYYGGQEITNSYNGQALARSNYLAFTLNALALKNPESKDQYIAAIGATGQFKNGVGTQTGNDDKNIKVMTANQVYTRANDSNTLTLLSTDDCEECGYIKLYRHFEDKHVRGLRVDSLEEDPYNLEEFYLALQKELADDPNTSGDVIHKVLCTSEISGVTAEKNRQDKYEVTLPDFTLEIDDSDFDETIKNVIRSKLGDAKFLRDYLYAGVKDMITHSMNNGTFV